MCCAKIAQKVWTGTKLLYSKVLHPNFIYLDKPFWSLILVFKHKFHHKLAGSLTSLTVCGSKTLLKVHTEGNLHNEESEVIARIGPLQFAASIVMETVFQRCAYWFPWIAFQRRCKYSLQADFCLNISALLTGYAKTDFSLQCTLLWIPDRDESSYFIGSVKITA